jgi:hypothetical protein
MEESLIRYRKNLAADMKRFEDSASFLNKHPSFIRDGSGYFRQFNALLSIEKTLVCEDNGDLSIPLRSSRDDAT